MMQACSAARACAGKGRVVGSVAQRSGAGPGARLFRLEGSAEKLARVAALEWARTASAEPIHPTRVDMRCGRGLLKSALRYGMTSSNTEGDLLGTSDSKDVASSRRDGRGVFASHRSEIPVDGGTERA